MATDLLTAEKTKAILENVLADVAAGKIQPDKYTAAVQSILVAQSATQEKIITSLRNLNARTTEIEKLLAGAAEAARQRNGGGAPAASSSEEVTGGVVSGEISAPPPPPPSGGRTTVDGSPMSAEQAQAEDIMDAATGVPNGA